MLTVWQGGMAYASLRPTPFIPHVIGAFRPLAGPLADTLHTPHGVPDEARPTRFRRHPRPRLPWRIVPHVLGVTALQLRNPVLFLVLMEADDLSRDR